MSVSCRRSHLSLIQQIEKIESLLAQMKTFSNKEKVEMLEKDDFVQESLVAHPDFFSHFLLLREETDDDLVVFSVCAIGQAPLVFRLSNELNQDEIKNRLVRLLNQLKRVEKFYSSIGGILGYHLSVLKLIESRENSSKKSDKISYESPPRFDLTSESPSLKNYLYEGLKTLDKWCELYPIGGLGDRLSLHDENHQPLPAACLKFNGKTLLEGLIRDTQAREYLFYKLEDKQVTIPIAMMTSLEKSNHQHITSICEENEWFGRGEDSFKLFCQPSVPVVTVQGLWSMNHELELNLKPGGHGIVWKLAEEEGVFEWFLKNDREKILVRQINNPIAGVDYGLIAFMGVGLKEKKTFGLSSCPRRVHAAEGTLIFKKEKKQNNVQFSLSNIEYTDFEQYGIQDVAEQYTETQGFENQDPESHSYSCYPANTNILYVDLNSFLPLARDAHESGFLPGLMINMKNKAPYIDEKGIKTEVEAGRLETMMQNICDCFSELSSSDQIDESEIKRLKSYIAFNKRKKTISVTKRSFEQGKSLLETPEGCFYDHMVNAYDLLKRCDFECPPVCSTEDYLIFGPSWVFKYHPALGPLYSIIEQKIRGGALSSQSELLLDIAEIDIEKLDVAGSFMVRAENSLGHKEGAKIIYSSQASCCTLKNVQIKNKGLKFSSLSSYWKDCVEREESCTIQLGVNSEFYAENVTIQGNFYCSIPDHEKWTLKEDSTGSLVFFKESIEKPTWQWSYSWNVDKNIQLIKKYTK